MLVAMGPYELAHLSRTLWLVVAIPILGALFQGFVVRRWIRGSSACATGEAESGRKARPSSIGAIDSARVAGLATIALTTAAFMAHVVQLRGTAGAGLVLDAVVSAAPGSVIDTSLVLALDRLSASLGAVACVVALASAAQLASRPSPQRGWAAWAWLDIALASTLMVLLADGVCALAIGWAMATVVGAWILASDDARASVAMGGRGALAIGALIVGGGIVYLGLEGDGRLQYVAVHADSGDAGATSAPGAMDPGASPMGALTMTSPPGAEVLVDRGLEPGLRVPFVRAPVASGRRVLHVHGSPGMADAVIELTFAPGDHFELIAVGPTLSFHAMASELALRDPLGAPPAALGGDCCERRPSRKPSRRCSLGLLERPSMCCFPFVARSPVR